MHHKLVAGASDAGQVDRARRDGVQRPKEWPRPPFSTRRRLVFWPWRNHHVGHGGGLCGPKCGSGAWASAAAGWSGAARTKRTGRDRAAAPGRGRAALLNLRTDPRGQGVRAASVWWGGDGGGTWLAVGLWRLDGGGTWLAGMHHHRGMRVGIKVGMRVSAQGVGWTRARSEVARARGRRPGVLRRRRLEFGEVHLWCVVERRGEVVVVGRW